MSTAAPVILHGDPDAALTLASEIESLIPLVQGIDPSDCGTQVVLLVAYRRENQNLKTLAIDVLSSGNLVRSIMLPCLTDWPIVGAHEADTGRLNQNDALQAMSEAIKALRSCIAIPEDDGSKADRIKSEAIDWIAALNMTNPAVIQDLADDDGNCSILIEQDSSNGSRFVMVMKESFSSDVRIDGHVTPEQRSKIAFLNPAHLTLQVAEEVPTLTSCDIDSTLVHINYDPVTLLRHTARLLEF